MEDKEEKKKFEFDAYSILSITVMAISLGIAIYFLFSFGK